MSEQYHRHPNTSCVVCNNPIYKRPAEIEKNEGRVFCSVKCYGVFCRKESPCAVCGQPILAGLNKKTCSRKCANIQRAGIKYHLGQPRDRVVSQRALKVRLLEARGTKCERCDYDRPEILQVHHKNRDTGNNEFDNLELVCPNCHFEEHHLERSWLKDAVAQGEVG